MVSFFLFFRPRTSACLSACWGIKNEPSESGLSECKPCKEGHGKRRYSEFARTYKVKICDPDQTQLVRVSSSSLMMTYPTDIVISVTKVIRLAIITCHSNSRNFIVTRHLWVQKKVSELIDDIPIRIQCRHYQQGGQYLENTEVALFLHKVCKWW